MKIIHVPHPSLRQITPVITAPSVQLRKKIAELSQTLEKTTNPKGVGLAAPQVNWAGRVFVTRVNLDNQEKGPEEPHHFINPSIVDHSAQHTLGPDPEQPVLEGCLSIPGIYGPVPRWEWITLEYQILENDKLITKKDTFEEYAARVMQHELDHLNGILFIDHSLEYKLPVYREEKRSKDLILIDPGVVSLLG
jgi:peptide deformylase